MASTDLRLQLNDPAITLKGDYAHALPNDQLQ